LVSPISTCFKYFKSHSGHVCHFAELIYARLYLFYIAGWLATSNGKHDSPIN
ncbi:hypothetical protein T4B_4922, partial [Trichinella pseudospiralis]